MTGHDDLTDHSHGLPHRHGRENPHAGQGAAVADLGGDLGALVLRTPPEMDGAEIEISRVGGPRDGRHVEVLPRHIGGPGAGRVVHAAFYSGLREGRWRLWHPDGTPGPEVTVAGGVVTDAEWVPAPR